MFRAFRWEHTPSASLTPSCLCHHQVRKILDLVQSKGEEVSEFFLYVLQQLADAYVDLRPWLSEIGFSPSELIQSKAVVNTDPGTSQPVGTEDAKQTRSWGLEMLSRVGSGQAGCRPRCCVLVKRRAGPCHPSAAQETR